MKLGIIGLYYKIESFESMSNAFDAIVIGLGLGGLTAGALYKAATTKQAHM